MPVPVALPAVAGRPLGGQHRGDREHAGQPLDRDLAGLAQRLLGRALGRVDLEREADIAVAHDDAADEVGGNDGPPAVRVHDIGQRRQNLFLGDRRHRFAPTPGSRADAQRAYYGAGAVACGRRMTYKAPMVTCKAPGGRPTHDVV